MTISSKKLAKKIRIHALKMVAKAKASHIGSALSIADIVAVLYAGVLNNFPECPKNEKRDRFILSKGHACVAVYAGLAEIGFFSIHDLKQYGENYSLLMNHISHKVPGVEFSTGSLGHGLPFATGKSLYAKFMGKTWQVFALLSDGELDEGSNWEAIMFAAHHNLNNLTVIVDYNKLQSLASIEHTLRLEPLADKFRAFGANVIEVDGHNHLDIKAAFNSPQDAVGPKIIIAHTIKGKGVSFMENQIAWHYKSPTASELELAIAEIEADNA